MLRQRAEQNKQGVYTLFPYVPWERRNSKVAVEVDDRKSITDSQHPAGHDALLEGGLERVLTFPPLLQAFEGFCLKALCIEVRRARLSFDSCPHQTSPVCTYVDLAKATS